MYYKLNSPFGDGAHGLGPWRCWLTPARCLPRCELPGSYTLNLAHGHGGHGEGSFGASILGRFSRASAGGGDCRDHPREPGVVNRIAHPIYVTYVSLHSPVLVDSLSTGSLSAT